MAIKENALPLGASSGSGSYIRTVSSGGESQRTSFDVVKGAMNADIETALENEVSAREDADTALSGEITDAVAAEVTARNQAIASAIATEVTDRNAAIAEAQDETEQAISTAISGEVTARNQAIASAIQTETADRTAAIQEAIADEVTDRNEAIASAIDDEETARNTAISEAVAAEAQAREAADEELDQSKANTDGNYPDMTVGNADQLISSIYTEDQIPYNFRQSGGGLSIGDREIDKIVGGTIAWNQILDISSLSSTTFNGVTITNNGDGSLTLDGTVSANGAFVFKPNVPFVGGHKLLVSGFKSPGSSYMGFNGVSVDTGNGGIGVPTSGLTTINARIDFRADDVFSNVKIYPQYFDLTQMFGSAIADYIYSLEQATAGAGAAYFRKLFPKPYYAYNAGELMSVQAASHDMVGFNQWDEEWELGNISAQTGDNISSTTAFRSKNLIPVLPNTGYFFKVGNGVESGALLARYYDAEGNYIGSTDLGGNNNGANRVRTMPSNCHYFRFAILMSAYGSTTYNNDICINLSHNGSRNGEYEPYEKHSYELDANLTLRGIPKLDASNNLYYDGDEYESDGTVNRRYGVVDLGTLNWIYQSFYDYFYSESTPQNIKEYPVRSNPFLCSRYETISDGRAIAQVPSGCIYNAIISDSQRVCVKDSAYTDAAAFKTAMSGVMLVYELATPTEESAAPYTNPQTVSDWGTEEYVDAAVQEGDRDVAVPVGHVTDYLANLRDKLQNLPDAANADGTYLVQQTSGQMALLAYTPGVNIPAAPTTDGTYTLQAVVSGGVATYSWVSS